MFYGSRILLTFFSQKHVFSAHSVTLHVLNLFAFILPYWCVAITQDTLLCHVSLGVCHILVRNCSNIQHHLGQDRKLKEITTKTKLNRIADNMEPDFVLQDLYLLWSAAVLNMSRNFNFICMSDLLVTFPHNHILCFYTEWKKGIQRCCDSQWVFAKTKSINCFVGFALHLVIIEFECIKFDLIISVCNQKQTKTHHEAFF